LSPYDYWPLTGGFVEEGASGWVGAAGGVLGAASCFGAAVPPGAVELGWVSNIVADGFLPAKYPRVKDVIMKTMAMPVVSLLKKFPAPLLPKIVELEPPKTAPTSAPFPVCNKTTSIKPMHTIT
jgi:hypothetical protein